MIKLLHLHFCKIKTSALMEVRTPPEDSCCVISILTVAYKHGVFAYQLTCVKCRKILNAVCWFTVRSCPILSLCKGRLIKLPLLLSDAHMFTATLSHEGMGVTHTAAAFLWKSMKSCLLHPSSSSSSSSSDWSEMVTWKGEHIFELNIRTFPWWKNMDSAVFFKIK